MKVFQSRTSIGAVVLIAFGVLFAGYAVIKLELGTFTRMGSGMFPMLVGLVITALGLLIIATEGRRPDPAVQQEQSEPVKISWRSMAAIITAMGLFSIIIPKFGIIPALGALVSVSSLAGSNEHPVRNAVLLTAGLSFFAYAVFVLLLRLPFPMIQWPY